MIKSLPAFFWSKNVPKTIKNPAFPRSKELRDKEDLLESHAESSVASASKLAERLRHFERQQQELETEAAEDRSRLRMELANAEAGDVVVPC